MSFRAVIHLFADDSGQDLIEYALLSGAISVGSILFVIVMNLLMRSDYQTWQLRADTASEPCAPGGCP